MATPRNDAGSHAFRRRRFSVAKAFGQALTAAAVGTLTALIAHHFARIWLWHQGDVKSDALRVITSLLGSLYEALPFLNGQSFVNKLPGLPGSTLLVLTFATVCILVFNLNITGTANQRKMEKVFSVMGKLELPHLIRERVNRYYEFLHTEYESLDGEVAKFSKDLSHTLQLDVVLFKYVDVLMQVPHWRGCSPDFQKQLVLSLNVRIYLPDDFIMRRGEVSTECYLINRGTCKLYEYPDGIYEPPTEAKDASDCPSVAQESRTPPTKDFSVAWSMGPHDIVSQADAEEIKSGRYKSISILKRGRGIGEFALLANYERSSDLRAVSFVEMCVVERDSFQQLLTRYTRDRGLVVTSIVRHRMLSLAEQGISCPLMETVQQVTPDASVEEAIEYVCRAINLPQDDPSIVFGMTTQLFSRLEQGLATTLSDDDRPTAHEVYSTTEDNTSAILPTSDLSARPVSDADLLLTVRELQDRLRRLEEQRRQPVRMNLPPRRRRRNNPNVAADSWSAVANRREAAHRCRSCLRRP